LSRIKEKYQAYERWASSERGQRCLTNTYQRYGPCPVRSEFRLLVIAHTTAATGDIGRMNQLASAAIQLPRRMRDRLWFATVDSFSRDPAALIGSWRRTRDVRSIIRTKPNGNRCEQPPTCAIEHLPSHSLF
jgi:hypothetical protein